MNCKICSYPNTSSTFQLKNANVFVCKQCSFHYTAFLDSKPIENIIIDDHPVSDVDKNYLRTQLQHNLFRFKNHANIVNQIVAHKSTAKILDVGCGGGKFLSLMQSNNIKCFGIELDINRLKFARQETQIKDIYPHPIESEFWILNHSQSFDVITLWDVIEHVNDPKLVISSAKQLLKPGGFIIIDTPCRNTFYHLFGVFTYKISFGKFPTFLDIMYSDHPFGHKQIFSKTDIKNSFNSNNIEVCQIRLFHELSFPIAYYIRKFKINSSLIKILIPITEFILKSIKIKNKMLLVGKLN